MNLFRQIPATLILIAINAFVFLLTWMSIGTFNEPYWTFGLLRLGAEYNPYTLDKEWYRIFSSMFMHGSIPHIVLNMYGLYIVGREIEGLTGTAKFLWVYFISGIAAALTSLYFGLFAIGVGASGAIFGMFGFYFIIAYFLNRKQNKPISPVLITFALFLIINISIAKVVNADTPAHLGGLTAGALIGIFSIVARSSFLVVRIEYVMLPLLIAIFFLLPRYQVSYYKFFQKVIDVEKFEKEKLSDNHSDEEYLELFQQINAKWDTTLSLLNAHTYLPEELEQDTFNLRRYITMQKMQNQFRSIMIKNESYIYMDSIEWVQDSSKAFSKLKHYLIYKIDDSEVAAETEESPYEPSKVWYDSEWVELSYPPGVYYRIGYRDSLGRWQGQVRDFYADGNIQMKGTYKNDKRDGIFIYYSDHHTYTSAGQYSDDQSIGKWETFHNNGRLASEVYYKDRYFMKNRWDSLGNQQVKNGEGKEIIRHSNGTIATEGNYIDGYKQGYWYGYHPNGQLYFEENYDRGRLIIGRSRNLKGEVFNYDESTLSPIPNGGYKNYHEYISSEAEKAEATEEGTVSLSFRVTPGGTLTDFIVEKSVSPTLNEQAKEIVKNGPSWIPAKLHGQEASDGIAYVDVTFKIKNPSDN